jgi:hypothetical protein
MGRALNLKPRSCHTLSSAYTCWRPPILPKAHMSSRILIDKCPYCLFRAANPGDVRRHIGKSQKCQDANKYAHEAWSRGKTYQQALDEDTTSESDGEATDSEDGSYFASDVEALAMEDHTAVTNEDEIGPNCSRGVPESKREMRDAGSSNMLGDDKIDEFNCDDNIPTPPNAVRLDLSNVDAANDDDIFYALNDDESHPPVSLIKEPEPDPVPGDKPAAKPKHKVTMEDVDDEDIAQGVCYVRAFKAPHKHPDPGAPLPDGQAQTTFEKLHEQRKRAGDGLFAPFSSEQEWELARWAVRNLGHGQMNSLLTLEHVSKRFDWPPIGTDLQHLAQTTREPIIP